MSAPDAHTDTDPGVVPDDALIGPIPDPALHVMSWNIRRRTFALHPRRADRWDHRAPRLRSLLQTERPSLLGAQEVLSDQAGYIADTLGDGYRSVGHGRGPHGGGEASPIYYDAGRLELLDWEQIALSDTPHRPGSRSWGNLIPRALVSARFRDRATSTAFLAMNTHLDHLSQRSRLRAAQSIRHRVTTSSLPVIFTADMNAQPGNAAITALLDANLLADTWAAAARRQGEEWGTFADYRQPRLDRGRIDFIMTSPEVSVTRTVINTQRHRGGWASDHLPVQAVLHLPQEGGAA